MTLAYTFTHDVLFKMLFVRYPDLLKQLVSALLGIRVEDMRDFTVVNPEIPPERLGEKFCRLDINMNLSGQVVDLEIQVADEGDYPERSLYYWAREYSSALPEGGEYKNLPRVILVSILGFKLFPCPDFHSEFRLLEVSRHVPLTDKQVLHYFELPKLPKEVHRGDGLKIWLSLFNAKTEEDLQSIEKLGVDFVEQAIGAYHTITADQAFRNLERMRFDSKNIEASALGNARRQGKAEGERIGEERADAKWQAVVADKDAVLADKDALIAELQARLGERE
jgi:predicted transposase/invertase (TIGR01784 family)